MASNEEYLAAIVHEILPIPLPAGSLINQKSLLELGFDSLLLASLEGRLHAQFGCDYGTIHLGMSIDDIVKDLKSGQKTIESNLKIDKNLRIFPLSTLQKRILLETLTKDDRVFDEQVNITIDDLNLDKLKAAWKTLSIRHSILRCTVNRGRLYEGDDIVEITNSLEESPSTENAIPINVNAIRNTVIIQYHHMMLDGSSLRMLLEELLLLYNGRKLEGTVQYPKYVGFPMSLKLSPEFDKTVGFFLNQLVFKVKPNEFNTFTEVLQHVNNDMNNIKEHSTIPYNVIYNETDVNHPEYLVIDDKIAELPKGITIKNVKKLIIHKMMIYIKHDNKDSIYIDYNVNYFTEYTIRLFLQCYVNICNEFLTRSEINHQTIDIHQPLLSRQSQAPDFMAVIETRLSQLDEDKVIVKDETTTISVIEFNEMVCKLSYVLRKSIVKTEQEPAVVVLMDRNVYLAIMVVSLWKAGYIPLILDKNWADDRIQEAMLITQPLKVVTDDYNTTKNALYMKDVLSSYDCDHSQHVENPFSCHYGYFSFTSGSTGTPKLVKNPRSALNNMLNNYLCLFEYDEDSVVYQVVNPAFDIFYADMLVSLASGGCLVMARGKIPDWKEVEQNNVTHAYIMPAYLNSFHSNINVFSKLKLLMFGGERIIPQLVEQLLKYDMRLCQLFGFTEHAIYTNYQWINKVDDIVYVGCPFDNTNVYCVSEELRMLPYDTVGYLYTSGMGLSESDESDRYLNINIGGATQGDVRLMYKTGDFCEFTVDGIRFKGRSDDCDKIKGHMINPVNIDDIVEKSGLCHESVTVIARSKMDELQKIIVSYVQLKAENTVDQVREYLDTVMNRYMMPTYIIHIDDFPLNSNGKVDKKLLKNSHQKYVDMHYHMLGSGDDQHKEVTEGTNDTDSVTLKVIDSMNDSVYKEGNVNYKDVNDEDDTLQPFEEIFGPDITLDSNLYDFEMDSLKLLNLMYLLEDKYDVKLDFKSLSGAGTPSEVLNNIRNVRLLPTYNQEHIWLLRDLNPDIVDYYRITVVLTFTNTLDRKRFEDCVKYIVEMNDSLQYTVDMDDEGLYLKNIGDGKSSSNEEEYKSRYQNNEDNVKYEYLDEKRVKMMFDHIAVDGHSLRLLMTQLTELFSCDDIVKTYNNMSLKQDSFIKYAQKSRSKDYIASYIRQLRDETGLQKFIIGIPYLNRDKDTMNLVGYMANTLPLLFEYKPTYDDLLKQVKEALTSATEHSQYPLQLLKRDLGVKEDIIQRMVSFEDFRMSGNDVFTVTEVEPSYLKFEQCWYFWVEDGTLTIKVEYDGNKYGKTLIEGCIERLKNYITLGNTNEGPRNNFRYIKHDGDNISYAEGAVRGEVNDDFIEKVLEIYRRELSNPNLTVNDNFFDQGGHSLLASKISNKIRKTLHSQCSTRHVFEYQTVAELRKFLVGQQKVQDETTMTSYSKQKKYYSNQNMSYSNSKGISDFGTEEMYHNLKHICFTEQSLLYSVLRTSEDIRKAYYHYIAVDITDLNIAKIRLLELINSQEILRTEFVEYEGRYQAYVHSNVDYLKLPYVMVSRGLGLETVNINIKDNMLVMKLHHVCADGYSMTVMKDILLNEGLKDSNGNIKEVNTPLHEGNIDELRGLLNQRYDCNDSTVFWQNILQSQGNLLFKDTNKATETCTISCVIDKKGIMNMAKECKVSYNSIFMYNLHNTMSHWKVNPEDNIYINLVKDIREQECGHVMGHFVQLLPVPYYSNLNDLYDAMSHIEDRCYFDITRYMAGHNIVSEVMLVFTDDDLDMEHDAKCPITFFVKLENDTVVISCVYMNYWHKGTMQSMLDTFVTYLQQQNVARLPYTTTDLPLVDPISLIMSRCLQFPTNIALQSPQNTMTYDQLYKQLLQTSRNITIKYITLYGRNLISDTVIGIMIDTRYDAIPVILSVVYLGASYLFVDPDTPPLRINQMMEDTNAAMLITQKDVQHTKAVRYDELFRDNFEDTFFSTYEGLNVDGDFKTVEEEGTDVEGDSDSSSSYSGSNINREDYKSTYSTCSEGNGEDTMKPQGHKAKTSEEREITISLYNKEDMKMSQDTTITDCKGFLSDLCYIVYTSGSTGTPKSVAIERKALANTLNDATEFLKVDEHSVIYQFTKLCFDNSVLEVFLALTTGATLFVNDDMFSSEVFASHIKDYNITHAFLFPGLVSTFEDNELFAMSRLKYWIVGAEPLSQHLLDKALSSNINIFQNYGPTETTCYAMRRVMTAGDTANNLGSSVANMRCLVVSDLSRQQPLLSPAYGAPRELLISGVGLMRGYLGPASPVASTEPFVMVDKERYYKSGDMVRLTRHGDVLFCGRFDAQVKIRGFRVDLREIESVISQIDGIVAVKAVVNNDDIGVYYTWKQVNISYSMPTKLSSLATITSSVTSRQTSNPSLSFDQMPLTANSKIDVRALKEMKQYTFENQDGQHLKVYDIWREVLRYDKVRIYDNFFEVGGNSLSAFTLLRKVKKEYGISIKYDKFLKNSTIEGLLQYLSVRNDNNQVYHEGNKESKDGYIGKNYQQDGGNVLEDASNSIVLSDVTKGVLSYQQEQIYFLNLLNEDYDVLFVQKFTLQLDILRLQKAINTVIKNHEVLRTQYLVENDDILQQVIEVPDITLEVLKCKENEITTVIESFKSSKTDTYSNPIRLQLYRTESYYCLLLLVNHIATDATSTMLLEQYISDAYNNVNSVTPTVRYIDWSIMEKRKSYEYKKMYQHFKTYYNIIKKDCFREISVACDTVCLQKSYNYIPTSHSLFSLLISLISKAFASYYDIEKIRVLIGAPHQNRTEDTQNTLGNFLNNIIVLSEYDNKHSWEENLRWNGENIGNGIAFGSLPFSFAKQMEPFDELFQVYVNCRYHLEDQQSLRIGCAINTDPITPSRQFPFECHVDVVDDKINVQWLIGADYGGVIKQFDAEYVNVYEEMVRKKVRNMFWELLDLKDGIPSKVNGDDAVRNTTKHGLNSNKDELLRNTVTLSDDQQFFELGGNSLKLIRLQNRVKREMNITLDLKQLYRDCTVNKIWSYCNKNTKFKPEDATNTVYITQDTVDILTNHSTISDQSTANGSFIPNHVEIINKGKSNLLVLFHSIVGVFCYRKLSKSILDDNTTVMLIDVPDTVPDTLEELALNYSNIITDYTDNYTNVNVSLAGFSFGAVLAYSAGQNLKFKYSNLISLDGIANSGEVNREFTFEEHQRQMVSTMKRFGIDGDVELVDKSWRLLQLAVNYNIITSDENTHRILTSAETSPNFTDFHLVRTERKDYGWPFMSNIRYHIRTLPTSHSALLEQHHHSLALIIRNLF
ncbi:unnamed protein product [Bursaphelenchus okinawaensis]|uniref:Carrier domain-containing protein n=1 Tax=Bursaphelenchus okinawaensis TaxID=465554 RepID=A0A811K6H7_9BILA|nr:unnamed protein product [Bursaphelenchus okinawaensis]CAG9092461.1 unnamed protein product [Bursaphelenchus okinawaensis]